MKKTFETPRTPTVDVRLAAGSIDVAAAAVDTTEIDVEPLDDKAEELMEKFVVEQRGDEIRVEAPERRGISLGRGPAFAVRVTCPTGTRLRTRTASADLSAHGRLGGLEAKTASGDLDVEDVDGDVSLNSASGDIRAGEVTGSFQTNTASGDVRVARALGNVKANAVSGDLDLGETGGKVDVNSVSGDLEIARATAGPITVNAVSGDVRLAIARGAPVWLDIRSLSGDMVSELTPSDAPGDGEGPVIEIRGKTVSGDVRIGSAP